MASDDTAPAADPPAAPDPPADPPSGPLPRLLSAEDRPARVYLGRLAPSGRRVQACALARIAELVSGGTADGDTLPWGQLGYQHTQAIRGHLAARYAPATANRMLAALRGVLTEAWRLGQMDAEALHRATDLAAVRGRRPPAGRHVSRAEIAAVLAGCTATPGGRRDAALVAVLYGTGMRRSEAVALDLADVDLAAGSVRVRAGKGGRHRTVFLPTGATATVRAWLEVRGGQPGPLFCPVRRGGHPQPGHRLTGESVGLILARRAEAAGVARFGAHDLRRTAVGNLLDAGIDIATVSQICGHADPGTTARYDRRPEQARQRAATVLQVPVPAPPGGGGGPGGRAPRRERGGDPPRGA
jgi:integrase